MGAKRLCKELEIKYPLTIICLEATLRRAGARLPDQVALVQMILEYPREE